MRDRKISRNLKKKLTEDSRWKDSYKPVEKLLVEVERRLHRRESIEALADFMASFLNVGVLQDAERYILVAGGKRLRAALCLLSAQACGASARDAAPLAVGVELFHAATLVIDDLIEDADMRRGRPAVHKLWGETGAVAVAVGLQLRALPSFIQSMRRAINSGEPYSSSKMVSGVGQTIARVLWGEVMQHRTRTHYDLDEEMYFRIIGDKTAALFEMCCAGAALIAGANDSQRRALRDYGWYLGLAFQITVDLLDLEGEMSRLGKSPGSDLKEGRVTLPLIYFFRDANEKQRRLMAKMLPPLRKQPLPREEIVAELDKSGAISQCRNTSRKMAARARRALSRISESPSKESLRILAMLAADRSR